MDAILLDKGIKALGSVETRKLKSGCLCGSATILKPILFYLLIILFDGSDINFS
jgi:hypothetical protein